MVTWLCQQRLTAVGLLTAQRSGARRYQPGPENHKAPPPDSNCVAEDGWVVTPTTRTPSIYTARPSHSDARCSGAVLAVHCAVACSTDAGKFVPEAKHRCAQPAPMPSPRLSPALTTTAILPSGRIPSLRCHGKVTMSLCWLMYKVRSGPLRAPPALRFTKFSWLPDLLQPAAFDSARRAGRCDRSRCDIALGGGRQQALGTRKAEC